MLATLVEELPRGAGWLFEPKWDGYRALGYVRGGEATLRSRRGNDLTERFAEVAKELPKALRTPDAVVDGEVCALDEQGRPSFSAMQQDKPGTPLVYEIFDVLEIDGEPLLGLPLTERRERLEQLVIPSTVDPGLRRLRGRRGVARGGARAGTRGRDGQEGHVPLPGRAPRPRLAQDQDARPAGVRDLRLDEGPGPPRRLVRRTRPRRPPRQGVRLGRERRHRLQRAHDRRAPHQAPSRYERETTPFAAEPKMPKVRQRRRRLGRAEARLRGRVPRVDARRPPARAVVPGAPRRQACARGSPGGARGAGRPRREALQPRQALLAGGRPERPDHEGRPHRLLPRRCAGARPASEGPAVHDEALPRRGVRQGVLPEGRAEAHAGVDPALRGRGLDA